MVKRVIIFFGEELIMGRTFSKKAMELFFLEVKPLKNKLPSARDICESIKSFADGNESEIVFLSTEMPVRFYLDGAIYTAHRGGSPSGPIILCQHEQ